MRLGRAAAVLELRRSSGALALGTRSSNGLDVHDPFAAVETQRILDLVPGADRARAPTLEVPVPGGTPRWRCMVEDQLGSASTLSSPRARGCRSR